MNEGDPQYDFAVEVVRQLQQAGYDAVWAGGCVRDLLMDRQPQDYDVATSAQPADVRRLFDRTLPVGESFGVILVLGPRQDGESLQVEVATFRTEGEYSDGRRPDHVQFATAEEDAWRRDFTINGMFFDPVAGRPVDYVGGEEDLKRGLVRAIGEPHDRMREDKLRMLRAVRFTAGFDFELDAATERAIVDMAREIHVVSAERIADELRKMLVNRHRRRAVRLMQQTGLLLELFSELKSLLQPEVPRAWSHTLDLLEELRDPGFELALASLLHTVPSGASDDRRSSPGDGTASGVCRRLKLSNKERQHIVWLVEHQHALDNAQSLPLAMLKRLLASPYRDDLIELVRASAAAAGSDSKDVEFVTRFLAEHSPDDINPPPLVTGEDLIAAGLTPGPEFQRLLDAVRDAQLNEEIDDRDAALPFLRRLLDGTEA